MAFNYAANETFAGAIGGNGALTTLGSHTLTLTNIETYSGPTTISAGTLMLGNGITSGAVAGNIVNNSALIFNNPVAADLQRQHQRQRLDRDDRRQLPGLDRQEHLQRAVTVSGGTLSLVGGSLYSNLSWANPAVTVTNGGEIVVSAWSDTDSSGTNGGFGPVESSPPRNLVLNGGTIRYVGTTTAGGNWDRGFTIGPNGATLDASGSVTFQLNATRNANGYG